MAKSEKGFLWRLFPWLLVFALGFGSGYYFSDQRQDERVADVLEGAARELVERGQQAGDQIGTGTRSAIDSAKAAILRRLSDSNEHH
jgi:hypothetical protein